MRALGSLLLLSLFACSSSGPSQLTGGAGTGGTGASTSGTGGNAGNGADAGNVCPHLVGTADCSGSEPGCQPTWADVLANPVCVSGALDYSHEVRFDCNGYHVSQVQHVDTAQTYFYDATTGALVAIYRTLNVLVSCVAGPPSGVDTNCPNATPTQVCPIDAGAQIVSPSG